MNRRRLTERIPKTAAGPMRREITPDFKYDKKNLKCIKKVLHNINVSLGTLISALNEFSRVKGPDISPDGLLGGLGYVTPVREMKEVLNSSIRNLSDVADSLADELANPGWKAEDDKEVKELIKEKEENEEKVEDMEEEQPLGPEDVVTSTEVLNEKTASVDDRLFCEQVKQALLKFSAKKI